jgi:hypothetical protein
MGLWSSIGCDYFGDETHGDVETLGDNVWGCCMETKLFFAGCNVPVLLNILNLINILNILISTDKKYSTCTEHPLNCSFNCTWCEYKQMQIVL